MTPKLRFGVIHSIILNHLLLLLQRIMRYILYMKYLTELQNIKCVVSAEYIDMPARLDASLEPTQRKKICTMLKNVDVYRLVYKVGALNVVGYVVLPHTGERLPCLIHLRGGVGDFAMLTTRTIVGQMVKYAHEGYVVIATQYPGVEGGDGADSMGGIDDIASIKKLRDILKGLSIADATNIGVKGHSRGGLMTYMLMREVTWVKTAIIASALTDQISWAKERAECRAHQIRMWGKSRKESMRRSPIQWVDALSKKVPLLIMHGSADARVDASQSIRMVYALNEQRIPVRFILFEGADHNLSEFRDEHFMQTLNWCNRFLKQNVSLPNMKLHGE